MSSIPSIRYVSNPLIFSGIILLFINAIGYFHYTTISSEDSNLLDDSPTNISEEEFWDNAYRKSDEPLEIYSRRLAELISNRMLLIDSKHAKPTFFENWILSIYSNVKGSYEWSNTEKAIRLGGGFCSQHAIVFNNILRQQDIQSRIIQLGGHVVNEVLIDGGWKAYDSDYNVVFNASIKDLENHSINVYKAYIRAGRPEGEAKHWQEVFATDADNWNYKKTRTYRDEKYYIEVASLYLVWIIPMILIFLGVVMRKRA